MHIAGNRNEYFRNSRAVRQQLMARAEVSRYRKKYVCVLDPLAQQVDLSSYG
jgi:hypothetical protein